MNVRVLILAIVLVLVASLACLAGDGDPVIFAAFAGDGGGLHNTRILVESVRSFGGGLKDAPVWIYAPGILLKTEKELVEDLVALGAVVKASDAPDESRAFGLAGKVFASAKAEADAVGTAPILVWMDDDTVVLKEPGEFILAGRTSLGYRPVTHQSIGSLYSEKPNEFWARVYRDLSVPGAAVFPMKTVADGKTLRPYFNAGLLVVKPARGILRKWAACFTVLYRDTVLVDMCGRDERTRVFLHQAALSGAILNLLKRDEMGELSDRYNYPIFFKEMYGADREFDSIDGVVTLRYDVYFQKPAPDWAERLKGPAATVSWLKERLDGERVRKEDTSTKMRFRFQHGGKG